MSQGKKNNNNKNQQEILAYKNKSAGINLFLTLYLLALLCSQRSRQVLLWREWEGAVRPGDRGVDRLRRVLDRLQRFGRQTLRFGPAGRAAALQAGRRGNSGQLLGAARGPRGGRQRRAGQRRAGQTHSCLLFFRRPRARPWQGEAAVHLRHERSGGREVPSRNGLFQGGSLGEPVQAS